MTAGARETALVLRHLAALRRTGSPAGQALALVAGAMPEGALRGELARAADALGRGESAEGLPPAVALAARGEAAGPAALEEAARGAELSVQAAAAIGGARGLLLGVAVVAYAFALAVPAVAGGFATLFRDFGSALPAPTEFFIHPEISGTLFVLAGTGALLLRWKGAAALGRWCGEAAWGGAGRLRLVAAALGAGLPEDAALAFAGGVPGETLPTARILALDPFERRTLEQGLAQGAPEDAVRLLAAERERVGAVRSRRFRTFAPLLFFGAAMVLAMLFLVAMYLPIFSIAGAVK